MFLWQDEESGEIAFYMKGADVVMHNVVQYNDWMDEEVSKPFCCCSCLLIFFCFSSRHLSLIHMDITTVIK